MPLVFGTYEDESITVEFDAWETSDGDIEDIEVCSLSVLGEEVYPIQKGLKRKLLDLAWDIEDWQR